MSVVPATTVFDSLLFRDAFGTERMRAVFSDIALLTRYTEGEIALAQAEAQVAAANANIENIDAQISGHLIQISSRIQGQVGKVYVAENQVVKKGDPIADLDPRDYEVAVENAKAALASAQANAAAAGVAVPLITVNTGANLTSAMGDSPMSLKRLSDLSAAALSGAYQVDAGTVSDSIIRHSLQAGAANYL